LVGTPYTACSKAFEAASIQSGVTKNVELFEKKSTDFAYHQLTNVTGEKIWVVTGTVVKVVRDRSVTYPIVRNSKGLIPAIVPTIGVGTGAVALSWRF
jgi:hypothetical protein